MDNKDDLPLRGQTENIRGFLLIAAYADGPFLLHWAPHISRCADFWQQKRGWEEAAWAMICEQEVRDGAIRSVATWSYNVEDAMWDRAELSPNGEQIRYHFERNNDQESTDWFILQKPGEVH